MSKSLFFAILFFIVGFYFGSIDHPWLSAFCFILTFINAGIDS